MLSLRLIMFTMFTACQAKTNESTQSAMPQAPIAVTFSTKPEAGIHVGQAVDLLAEITQEGEAVADAERVRFEIWLEEDNNQGSEEQGEQGEHGEHNQTEAEHASAGEENLAHDHHVMAGYSSDHEMHEAENRGNGLYGLTYHFEQSGTYSVMYHVDARGFHAMTAHRVIVEE